MRKISIVLLIVLLSAAFCGCSGAGRQDGIRDTFTPTARYLTNCVSQIELESNYPAEAVNTLFYSEQIVIGQKLTAPTEVPVREGYDFDGWYSDKQGGQKWNFDAVVTGGVTLYAGWVRKADGGENSYREPTFEYSPDIDPSITRAVSLNTVCGNSVASDQVCLTTGGIALLAAHSADVKEFIGYSIKNSSCSVVSATYDAHAKTVTVTYTDGSDEQQTVVGVIDSTANYTVAPANINTKAVGYEAKADSIAQHAVIMAGSSSMENWSTSAIDMAPVTTYNHGIGGSTVEQWSNGLAERLIYPYNPRAVVLYLGVNNIINSKMSGKDTGELLVTFLTNLHSRLPQATVYFVLINKMPNFRSYDAEIDYCNGLIADMAARSDNQWLVTIDAGKTLFKTQDRLNSAYFLTDGLHMSMCGYIQWGGVIKKEFLDREKELYGK